MGIKGGQRPGAGRKKGVPNKRTAAVQKAVAKSGLTPLGYMIARLRDEKEDPKVRREMAQAAAPYVHPRLSAVAHSGPDGGPISVQVMFGPD